jgi:putative zinc finger protein
MISTQIQCAHIRAMFSAYLDGALTGSEMQSIARHMQECGECRAEYASLAKSQRLVASLGRKAAPSDLALRLKVALSRESQRMSWYESLALQWQTAMHNFMLPATAGLFSALLFFGVVIGYVALPASASARNTDVPTMLFTPAQLRMAPSEMQLGLPTDESIVVETLVDANGRVESYRVISAPVDSEKLTPKLDNMMIFTIFRPATAFGKPTPSRVVLSFSSVNVRG